MGTATEVSAKRSGNDHQVTVPFDFGENLAEAVELFGDDVVFGKFKAASIVDFQGLLRRGMFDEEGEGDDKTLVPVDSETLALREGIVNWKPGVSTRVTRSPKEKALAALKGMSPADIAAMLAELEGGTEGEEVAETTAESKRRGKKANSTND